MKPDRHQGHWCRRDAFDFLEGPFMVRTLLYPEKVKELDIERTIDRIIAALQA